MNEYIYIYIFYNNGASCVCAHIVHAMFWCGWPMGKLFPYPRQSHPLLVRKFREFVKWHHNQLSLESMLQHNSTRFATTMAMSITYTMKQIMRIIATLTNYLLFILHNLIKFRRHFVARFVCTERMCVWTKNFSTLFFIFTSVGLYIYIYIYMFGYVWSMPHKISLNQVDTS